MAMNFGHWVVVAFALFAIFIGTLVAICVKQDVNLVSKDYYKEELAYQDQIKRINNTSALITKPVIQRVDNIVRISFGERFTVDKGAVTFFSPSNPNLDQHFNFVTSKNVQQFDIGSLKKGMYKVRVLWVMKSEEYYYEEIINI